MIYERLPLTEFSRELIASQDLDPVYTMLFRAQLGRPALRRWLLSYLCFYHVGVASRCAEREGEDFHQTMQKAQDEKWPRGAERRHFRGAASQRALEYLRLRYLRPEGALEHLEAARSFTELSHTIRQWPAFGPWVAFKAADLCERVLERPVDFSDCELQMYEAPAAAAREFFPHLTVRGAVKELLGRLGPLPAPPRFERPINLQEAETCLCKGASHHRGNYPPGKDSLEIYHALSGWGDLAESLREHVPGEYLHPQQGGAVP